jgi:cation diffusion facilitator family transporter
VRFPPGIELPERLERANRRAQRLEWISLVYWLSAIVLLYFTLGQSQAMKAAWIEDVLALFPPVAFLIASRFRNRDPNRRFPYGYHRSITVAYMVATVALFALGLFILIDSVDKLLRGTHPPIGMVEIFDTQVWLGWLMIGALLYSGIPPVIFGRLKRPLSAELHDKVLFADAKMNQADWLTAGAAILGVVGIGLGLWWADAAAAIVIGLDIVHDGLHYTRAAAKDVLDGRPRRHDERGVHPLVGEVRETVAALGWVEEAAIRTRELGHVFSVEVLAVPRDEHDLLDRVEEAVERICALDWKVQDAVVAVVRDLEDAPEDVLVKAASAGSVRA